MPKKSTRRARLEVHLLHVVGAECDGTIGTFPLPCVESSVDALLAKDVETASDSVRFEALLAGLAFEHSL